MIGVLAAQGTNPRLHHVKWDPRAVSSSSNSSRASMNWLNQLGYVERRRRGTVVEFGQRVGGERDWRVKRGARSEIKNARRN